MEELLDRSGVAEAAFTAYIRERNNSYYLADTERWSISGDRWKRKYWLGNRTSLNTSERVYYIDFHHGTTTIERQWQE